jgi:hypothetical protein
MRVFRDPDEGQWEKDAVSFAAGALGGLALGVLLSRTLPQPRALGNDLRERARTVARRLRPARLRRLAVEQGELDELEDGVLAAFLEDTVLSERGVDIGAISRGIIELSGSVWTEEESQRAVSLASRLPGVQTVVNRLEVEELGRRSTGIRRPLDVDDEEGTFAPLSARGGGMGRRRQGRQTDPDQFDDSQPHREDALAAADRDQFVDEGLATSASRMNERPEVHPTPDLNFREDELDNQDPHGKHARYTLDEPPQELNSGARVGDGMKPGTARRIEGADLSADGRSPRDRES